MKFPEFSRWFPPISPRCESRQDIWRDAKKRFSNSSLRRERDQGEIGNVRQGHYKGIDEQGHSEILDNSEEGTQETETRVPWPFKT